MNSDNELLQNMTAYIETAIKKIGRINRRVTNGPATGETFDLLNRKLVSKHDLEALRQASWRLVLVSNALYDDVHYWSTWQKELENRERLDDDEEAGKE